MTRVRFAPSPTGSLHVGNALSAVANRRFGDWLLLRIDDTDPARNRPGGEESVLADLRWLSVDWDEGPVRQSQRAARHMEAAGRTGRGGGGGGGEGGAAPGPAGGRPRGGGPPRRGCRNGSMASCSGATTPR